MTTTTYKSITINKVEHDTMVISSTLSNLTVVFDPFQSHGTLHKQNRADIVFISHDHFDHFSPKDIVAVGGKNTVYVFPASILDKVHTFLDVPEERLIPVVPLEEYTIQSSAGTVQCMAVPAYNIDKRSPQGSLFHPKEKEYVGYIITVDGVSVYFVGDSDPIPEMDALIGQVEVLLLPISGVYVMNLQEGIELTQKLAPALVIPMHYGSVVGEATLGEEFRQQLSEAAPTITVAV